MNLEALQAFTSHKEFIDANDPQSIERVAKVSHELNALMQHTAAVQQEIKNVQAQIEYVESEIEVELKGCETELDTIKRKQQLKPKYEFKSKLTNDLSKLKDQLAEANQIYNVAKAKLDLIYKHSVASSREEAVMSDASAASQEQQGSSEHHGDTSSGDR